MFYVYILNVLYVLSELIFFSILFTVYVSLDILRLIMLDLLLRMDKTKYPLKESMSQN